MVDILNALMLTNFKDLLSQTVNQVLTGITVLFTIVVLMNYQSLPEYELNSTFYLTVTRTLEDKQRATSGSGVFIAPNIGITASHVVNSIHGEDLSDMVVYSREGKLANVKGVYTHHNSDLAYLLFDRDIAPKYAKVTCRIPDVLEPITITGNPEYLRFKIFSGTVAGFQGVEAQMIDSDFYKPQDLLWMTAPVAPGLSGGPVFDRHGEVIGIVSVGTNENQWSSSGGAIPSYIFCDQLPKV